METLRRYIHLRREFSEYSGHWPGLLIVAAARIGARAAVFRAAAFDPIDTASYDTSTSPLFRSAMMK